MLGLGDWSGGLEIWNYEPGPSETGLEYWKNFYKNLNLALASPVSPALSSTFQHSQQVQQCAIFLMSLVHKNSTN